MFQNKVFALLSSVLVAASLSMVACEKGEENAAATSAPETTSAWMLETAPEGAVDVAQAKANAKEGEQIVLVGRVGGRLEPITTGSGLFVVMDTSVPSCADIDEDHCATPWDYCCEAPESITANAATVQLRDAEGKPITFTENDIKPLNQVAVVGTVAPRPNRNTLIVHATGVHVISEN